MMNDVTGTDLIAFSSDKFGTTELRTSFLLKDAAFERRVYFIESPILSESGENTYYIQDDASGVRIVKPYLSKESSVFEQKKALLELIKDMMKDEHIFHYSMWTDTPVAMAFIRHLSPDHIVYDCLRDYSVSHPELERELLQYADSVQTPNSHAPLANDPLKNLRLTKFKETYFNL